MKPVVAVNPFSCRMWEMHDRIETEVTEESCKAEIESFTRHGQLIPVLGRPLHRDPRHEVELIYGARRLFVARHLNVPLIVELRELSDRDAIVAMDIENRQRTDISAYERGQSYARWLRAGHFQSQDDIARALRVSASQVSRLLKLAQLPPVVVAAFDHPAEICEGWGLEIVQALENPARRAGTIRAARTIAALKPRPAAREVYRRLVSPAVKGRRIKRQDHDDVIKDEQGAPLFRIRQQRNSIAFVLPIHMARPDVLDGVREAIADVLRKYKLTNNTDRAGQRRVVSNLLMGSARDLNEARGSAVS
jgi:ParB family transcriptional regulator, chromosome partitioning protein